VKAVHLFGLIESCVRLMGSIRLMGLIGYRKTNDKTNETVFFGGYV